MFFVYYNEQGKITSVSNEISKKENCIEISETLFNEFNDGVKEMNNFIVVEDIKQKRKFHVVSVNYDSNTLQQHTGIIKKYNSIDNGIQIVQNKNDWCVNNFMDGATCTSLTLGDDYIKEYYVVDANNRFILHDTFSVNLKKLAQVENIKVANSQKNKNVSIFTASSHIEHIHSGDMNENN